MNGTGKTEKPESSKAKLNILSLEEGQLSVKTADAAELRFNFILCFYIFQYRSIGID